MKYIGLMSDTHGFLDEEMLQPFSDCDEIWHAGDLGENDVAVRLSAFRPLRAVYGNIDGLAVRQQFPEDLHFVCEGLKVCMTHIGGYPGKYVPRVRRLLFVYLRAFPHSSGNAGCPAAADAGNESRCGRRGGISPHENGHSLCGEWLHRAGCGSYRAWAARETSRQ